MLLSRSTTVIALSLIGLGLPYMPPSAPAQEPNAVRAAKGTLPDGAPPPSCHVTLPSQGTPLPSSPIRATDVGIGSSGTVGKYGTESLWTLLPTDGIWRGPIPRKPGDFAYSNKLPWRGAFRGKDGPLTITGKRLDGPAPAFTESEEISGFPNGDVHAGIMGGINIPVFGCWEITGRYKRQELRFIVWVTPITEQNWSLYVPLSETVQGSPASPRKLRRIHVDGEVQAKSLVYRVTPEIPHEAQVANVSGRVVLHALITEDGRAHELQYISGSRLLEQAAINAVSWWEYRVSGEAEEVDTTIEVVFPATKN